MARRNRIPTTYAGSLMDTPGQPPITPSAPEVAGESPFDLNEQHAPREPLVIDPEGKESEAYWTIPPGTFPLFPWEKKFRHIAKKFGKIGGVRIAKKINGKFRDEMLRMPDGRIDSKPYDNQKFSLSDIEEMYGPGEYQTVLYSDISAGNAEIWSNYWTITGGQSRPFPCIIPPSDQGFPDEYDENPMFNPTMTEGATQQETPPSFGGMPERNPMQAPSLFEQHAGGSPGMPDFMNRNRNPFAREEPKPDDDRILKYISAFAAIAAPIVTTLVTNSMERSKHQMELDTQRMLREEERQREIAADRKREREHEIRLEEERESRRAEERRQRLAEERARQEWEDRRRKDEEERQRARDDYEEKKRLDAEDRQAKYDQQRQDMLRQQFEANKPTVDPQIVQMVKALDARIEGMQKGGPLGNLKSMLSEFSTMRDELEKLGLAGGSAPQGPSGLESFIGNVLGSIPEEKIAAIIKTVGSATGMLSGGLPASIPLT